MKAMLLAAGFGKRLLPLTSLIPKPLIPVGGLPIIFYNLALLKHYGITDVVINLHHLGKSIEKILGDGKKFGLQLKYSYEPKILGTGGGIAHAKKLLKATGPFLVLNADIIIDVNLKRLAAFHRHSKNQASLVVRESPLAKKFGALSVDLNGRIVSILSPTKNLKDKIRKTFFTGVHVLEPDFFKTYPPKKSFCIIRDYYIPLLRKQKQIGGFIYKGYWNDLGDLKRLRDTANQFQRGKIKLSYRKTLTKFKHIGLGKTLQFGDSRL